MQINDIFEAYFAIVAATTRILRSIPLLNFQLMVLMLWVVLFLYMRFLLKRKKTVLFSLLAVALTCSSVLLMFRYIIQQRTYYVVTRQQAQALSGPGSDFTVIGSVPGGQEVIGNEAVGNFIKARWRWRTLWINQQDLKKL